MVSPHRGLRHPRALSSVGVVLRCRCNRHPVPGVSGPCYRALSSGLSWASLHILTPKGSVKSYRQLMITSLLDTRYSTKDSDSQEMSDFLPFRTFKYTTKLVLEFKFLQKVPLGPWAFIGDT